MAYVYRHIRLDKNEPFYIGIGSDSSGKHIRAYSKNKRNDIWSKIVNKTDYEIEILIDELSWMEACEKEKEFISIYGRINNKTGILSNLTDGGSGAAGVIIDRSIVEIDRQRKSIPIAQYDINGIFIAYHTSLVSASMSVSGNRGLKFDGYKSNIAFSMGFYWKKYTGDKSDIIVPVKKRIEIASFDKNGDFIKKYCTRAEAAKDLNISISAVYMLYTNRRVSTTKSVRLRVYDGNISNIGKHEYVPNWKERKIKLGSENGNSKKVNQIDRNTLMIINTFGCAIDAAKAIGIKNPSQISACCTGKIPSAGGYYWEHTIKIKDVATV